MLKGKWTMRAESWRKLLELERLFRKSNATLMKLGEKTYIIIYPMLYNTCYKASLLVIIIRKINSILFFLKTALSEISLITYNTCVYHMKGEEGHPILSWFDRSRKIRKNRLVKIWACARNNRFNITKLLIFEDVFNTNQFGIYVTYMCILYLARSSDLEYDLVIS